MSDGQKNKSVGDGTEEKFTNEQLGGLTRRIMEIVKRIKEKSLKWKEVMDALQGVFIDGKFSDHLGVIRGTHLIVPSYGSIQSDTEPMFPNDELDHTIINNKPAGQMKIELKGDKLYINNKEVNLYATVAQQMTGEKIVQVEQRIKNKVNLNAMVAVFLLRFPFYIPEQWVEKVNAIYFWDTIYKDNQGRRHVRYIFPKKDGTNAWDWESEEIDERLLHKSDFAITLAE